MALHCMAELGQVFLRVFGTVMLILESNFMSNIIWYIEKVLTQQRSLPETL